jgi:hypothetical protein
MCTAIGNHSFIISAKSTASSTKNRDDAVTLSELL